MMRPTIIATFLLAFFSLAASAADLGRVENQFFTIRDFALTNGTVMPEVKIAYETYGTLAPNGRNAVLITHGYTSTHHAAGRNPANGDNPGWWDGLIGPGKAIDTDKLRRLLKRARLVGRLDQWSEPQPCDRQALRLRFSGDHDARHDRSAEVAARWHRSE